MIPLDPKELRQRLDAGEELVILDVREPHETAMGVLPGSVLIPLGELSVRHSELDPDAPTVVVCHHGIRSANACVGLGQLGFETLFNLTGGTERWSRDVDPSLPRY